MPAGCRPRQPGVAEAVFARLLGATGATVARLEAQMPPEFRGLFATTFARRAVRAENFAALRHLSGVSGALAADFRASAAHLPWFQTYGSADFGAEFLKVYAACELVGPRGPFVSAEFSCGVLLLGPGVLYPEHWHAAAEVYVPLSGHAEWFRAGEGWSLQAPLTVIHHASNQKHAMRTGAEPLLALYIWRGGDLAQKSLHGTGPG